MKSPFASLNWGVHSAAPYVFTVSLASASASRHEPAYLWSQPTQVYTVVRHFNGCKKFSFSLLICIFDWMPSTYNKYQSIRNQKMIPEVARFFHCKTQL